MALWMFLNKFLVECLCTSIVVSLRLGFLPFVWGVLPLTPLVMCWPNSLGERPLIFLAAQGHRRQTWHTFFCVEQVWAFSLIWDPWVGGLVLCHFSVAEGNHGGGGNKLIQHEVVFLLEDLDSGHSVEILLNNLCQSPWYPFKDFILPLCCSAWSVH